MRTSSAGAPAEAGSAPSAGRALELDAHSAEGFVAVPRRLFDFLMGIGEIDGTSFSELHAGLPGAFWWRGLLGTCASYAPPAPDASGASVALLAAELRTIRRSGQIFRLCTRAAAALETLEREKAWWKARDPDVDQVMSLIEQRLCIIWHPRENRERFKTELIAALQPGSKCHLETI